MHTIGEAEEIADELLHHTGQGLMTGDFEIFRPCFDLPQTMETLEGVRVLRHEGDLRQLFESMRGYFKENGVVDLVRSVVSSEFLNADTVGSTHVSRLLQADGKLFRAPYPVYSVIKLRGDNWKIAYSNYVILDSRKHNEALVAWRFEGDT